MTPPARTGTGLLNGQDTKRVNSTKRPNTQTDPWDVRAAQELKKILIAAQSDLATVKEENLALEIHHLQVRRQVPIPRERIKQLIRWLRDHYQDPYTPKLYKRGDFEKNYGRLEDAMRRWQTDNGIQPDNPQHKANAQLVRRVYRYWEEQNFLDVTTTQSVIDEALVAIGEKPGQLTSKDFR